METPPMMPSGLLDNTLALRRHWNIIHQPQTTFSVKETQLHDFNTQHTQRKMMIRLSRGKTRA